MRTLVLFALIVAAAAVPMPQRGSRIVGGLPTTVEQYPYMSNMQYGFWGIWWYQACGGSLINSKAVMSAAHCYFGDTASSWRVLLGTSFASSGGSLHLVSRLVLHPTYSHVTLDNDIAIIHLATPAVYSDSVQPARIPGPNYSVADDTVVYSIGWGTLSSGGASPEQLQHVDVKVINQQQCAERYEQLKTLPGFSGWPDISNGMLCAGIIDVGGKDACQGDSGGPLAHKGDIIIGITSWGYSCAHAVYPGVNARVSVYSDWVVANA